MKAAKKWLAGLMALALLVCSLPAALAAETTIYLEGYSIQEEGGKAEVTEVKEGGQLSLTGNLTRTGTVQLEDYVYSEEKYDCPIYTADGPVLVTLTDGYVEGEARSGVDENGDVWDKLNLASVGIDSVRYDAEKNFYNIDKEDVVLFEGKITYYDEAAEADKTVTIQELHDNASIWDSINTPPCYHKGSKATLKDPGIYFVYANYEALEGGCIAYVIIPEPAAEEKPAQPAAPKFTDVAAASPFAAAIDWAVAKEITLGKTETTFGPADPCTVSHILTFLWRAGGKPGAEEGVADRDSAAKWAVEKKMVAGDADLTATCTRSMAVTFMWQAAESPKVETEKTFTDVAADADYAAAVAWAVENEITAGTGDGTTFSPDNPCNRGQIVMFLYRSLAE